MPVVRECGGCTACCKTHKVAAIKKRTGKWCKHCNIGHGCRIYDNRPTECKEFTCQWLVGLGSDEERPDRLGVVIDCAVQNLGNGAENIMGFWEVTEGALFRPFADTLFKNVLMDDMAAYYVTASKKKVFLYPIHKQLSPEIVRALKHQGFTLLRTTKQYRSPY